MSNVKLIGSVIKGGEYYYIAHHLNTKDQSILYVGRDDREIFNIKENQAINKIFIDFLKK